MPDPEVDVRSPFRGADDVLSPGDGASASRTSLIILRMQQMVDNLHERIRSLESRTQRFIGPDIQFPGIPGPHPAPSPGPGPAATSQLIAELTSVRSTINEGIGDLRLFRDQIILRSVGEDTWSRPYSDGTGSHAGQFENALNNFRDAVNETLTMEKKYA